MSGRVISALTPETETETHYSWNFVRDFDRVDAALTANLTEATTRIVTQDVGMLETQHRALTEPPDLVLHNLNIDASGARARRLIQKQSRAAEAPAMAAE